MYGHNQPDAGTLARMPENELHAYLTELLDRQREVSLNVKAVQEAMNLRFANDAQIAYDRADKDGGTVTVGERNGVVIKAKRDKKVEWDQAKLKALAANMSWAEIGHLFDIQFKVPERKFEGLMPGPFKDLVTAARTVTWSDTKITLEAAE
jgi:hypothetical protein